MSEGLVLHNELIDLNKLQIELISPTQLFNNNISIKINNIWEKRNKELYNGKQYRLESLDAPSTLTISETDYKTFYGLMKLGLISQYDLSHLSVGTTLKTSDGFYIIGERKNLKKDQIGGMLQPENDVFIGKDIEKHLILEIFEETGVSSTDIDTIKCIGLIKSKITTNILFHFDTQLKITKEKVENLFQEYATSEFSKLSYLSKEEYKDFLLSAGGYKEAILKLKLLQL